MHQRFCKYYRSLVPTFLRVKNRKLDDKVIINMKYACNHKQNQYCLKGCGQCIHETKRDLTKTNTWTKSFYVVFVPIKIMCYIHVRWGISIAKFRVFI